MITITNEDNLDLMARYEDNYFQLAIIDPPYGINGDNSRLQRLNGGGGKLKNRVLNTAKKLDWDNSIPNDEYFIELKRVSKNQIIWGGNYYPLPPTRCVIVWDKCQPWKNFSQVELGWTSFDMPASLFKYDNRTGGKIHPTQKPVALYKWLLNNYAKQGDKILDTHLGSGSIAIACHDYNFDLTACEIDKEYYEAALTRYNIHKSQGKLW